MGCGQSKIVQERATSPIKQRNNRKKQRPKSADPGYHSYSEDQSSNAMSATKGKKKVINITIDMNRRRSDLASSDSEPEVHLTFKNKGKTKSAGPNKRTPKRFSSSTNRSSSRTKSRSTTASTSPGEYGEKEDAAATKIQSTYRGFLARKQYKAEMTERNAAATKIQAGFRGLKARKETKERRQHGRRARSLTGRSKSTGKSASTNGRSKSDTKLNTRSGSNKKKFKNRPKTGSKPSPPPPAQQGRENPKFKKVVGPKNAPQQPFRYRALPDNLHKQDYLPDHYL